jgi:hypothetical protein
MIRDLTGSYTLMFYSEGVVRNVHPCAQTQMSPIPDQSLACFAVPQLRAHPGAFGARCSPGASSATMAWAAPVDLRKAMLPSIAARGGGGMEP